MMQREKLVIIWSWPAGHTAAIYAARAMLNPLMFEWFMAWGVAAGGQLTTTTDIENFPWFPDGIGGPDLMDAMRKQSLGVWARILSKTVDKIDVSVRPFKIFSWSFAVETDSIIVATWAVAKRLWLPGEETYRQKWISACAICDGALPLFREKDLIVIGGWDSACEEAHYLTKYAKKVIVLVRRGELRASKIMQERVLWHPTIEVLRHTQWMEVIWDGNVMTWIRVSNNQTWKEELLGAWWLFYAIWHKPNTDFLDWQLLLDPGWYILTYCRVSDEIVSGKRILDDSLRVAFVENNNHFLTSTSMMGVFACGDVQDKVYRQAITSAGSGCMAALEAEQYLAFSLR